MTDQIHDETSDDDFEMEVQIIRLLDGTDIIATVFNDQETYSVTIFDPMEFFFTNNSGDDELVMHHYLPIKVMDCNYATIDLDKILFMENAADSFEEFYTSTVQGMKDTSLRDSSKTKDQLDREHMIESFNDMDINGMTKQ